VRSASLYPKKFIGKTLRLRLPEQTHEFSDFIAEYAILGLITISLKEVQGLGFKDKKPRNAALKRFAAFNV
jgi:hypothetical protein